MEWTIMLGVLFTVVLTTAAEPVATTSQRNRSNYPQSASILTGAKPVREGELLMLHDHMKQGDTLLKERLTESFSSLKQLLKEGDARLKEQLVEGLDLEKEQRKDGGDRLRDELDEDVAWLKNKLAKGENRLKEELAEEEAETKEELADQKKIMEKLRNNVKEWTETNSAVMDQLKQQMSDVLAKLQQTTTAQKTTNDQLDSTQKELRATKDELVTALDQGKELKAELLDTRTQLQTVKTQLNGAENEVHALKSEVNRSLVIAQSDGQSGSQGGSDTPYDQHLANIGSTFIRWGSKSCPENTSLVYTGVVGGSWFEHTGGSSTYLCLVMDPELDVNMTLPSSYTVLYGGEYQNAEGQHDQDPVCSMCRAPQTSTIMIPATRTCPSGWTTQYRGHLMTGHHTHKRGTEYVCVDETKESRMGGNENKNGVLFYHVATRCGSLPCPPYINDKIITCVVCSA